MIKLILVLCLCWSSFVYAVEEVRDVTVFEKAEMLAQLSEAKILNEDTQNDIKQLFSGAVYEYRASVVAFSCTKKQKLSLIDCSIEIAIDHMNQEDDQGKAWSSQYRINATFMDKQSLILLKASVQGLAG